MGKLFSTCLKSYTYRQKMFREKFKFRITKSGQALHKSFFFSVKKTLNFFTREIHFYLCMQLGPELWRKTFQKMMNPRGSNGHAHCPSILLPLPLREREREFCSLRNSMRIILYISGKVVKNTNGWVAMFPSLKFYQAFIDF